ncbi:S-adenosylmethionine decarboxylase family protein [Larkinella punicea]|uniref:S-adenosylmethionine decarboxylase n=1 Tax=Larkinella punicea TaxID=2315727 RepID=A0A368JWJ4_9BACT|nr:S-adenosylmethionine decarboxylase [Larkinella punicea]RCR70963.1 S-adenosylmethionine decarboxylase [Larkinella punicea]
MNAYRPGLHILSTFEAPLSALTDVERCRAGFDRLIQELELAKVGEVYYSFPNGGFTAVLCLTESHVSIHTWPENGLATFDVFLSNFLRDNSPKVRRFYEESLRLFGATAVLNEQEIIR